MLASLAVGDSVVTTSGFYGVVIDLTEEGSDAENAGGSVKTEQTAQAEKTSQKDIAEKEKTLTSRQNLFIIILYGRLQVKAMTERVGFI